MRFLMEFPYSNFVHFRAVDEVDGEADNDDDDHDDLPALWVERYTPQSYMDLLSDEVRKFIPNLYPQSGINSFRKRKILEKPEICWI